MDDTFEVVTRVKLGVDATLEQRLKVLARMKKAGLLAGAAEIDFKDAPAPAAEGAPS